jgi:hypothetical protein
MPVGMSKAPKYGGGVFRVAAQAHHFPGGGQDGAEVVPVRHEHGKWVPGRVGVGRAAPGAALLVYDLSASRLGRGWRGRGGELRGRQGRLAVAVAIL